ncbi:MAG TPA: neutral zinc metallopeptidase [Rhizomicrobium sp.]|nr:neutral zinc metallopeptidase [Rhizomicrobium sp.]
MRLDDLRPSENVDDRRGEDSGGGGGYGGFGPRMVFGGGGLGLVVVLVLSLFFGVDPSLLLNGGPAPQPQVRHETGPRSDDAAYDFARRIIGSAEDVWSPLLRERGIRFTPATFTAYDYATPTGCGTGQSSAGPFYCPGDAHIYLDLAFFDELSQRFGAPGEFARAYVIAHEYGHHIQNLLGAMDRRGGPSRGADSDSVRTELQADCYAGVWAYRANQQFSILQNGDVEGALRAASSVGDDMLQKENQGYIVPDSFTHGSSAQRVRWFQRGLDSGQMDSCDTFSARSL